jgi:hypothetical protein
MADKPDARAVAYSGPTVIQDKESLRQILSSMASGAWQDFKTTNKATAGKATKFGASLVVGGAVAREIGALTPLQWAARGFGPLPMEFTKSGAIQVFEYSGLQRLGCVAATVATKFCLVTVA